jgi:hypothetical protein
VQRLLTLKLPRAAAILVEGAQGSLIVSVGLLDRLHKRLRRERFPQVGDTAYSLDQATWYGSMEVSEARRLKALERRMRSPLSVQGSWQY